MDLSRPIIPSEHDEQELPPETTLPPPEMAATPEETLPPAEPTPVSASSSHILSPPILDEQLCTMIYQHIGYVWDSWINSKKLPSNYGSFTSTVTSESNSSASGPISGEDTENTFELMVSDMISEIMQEILGTSLDPRFSQSVVDQIQSPLTKRVQELKLPETKEKLFELVYNEVRAITPPTVLMCTGDPTLRPEKKYMKWSCRPRDLVEEVLVQELVKETKSWNKVVAAEEALVDKSAENVIKRMISEVVKSFEVALK